MIDIVLIFSILLVSFICYKRIVCIDIREEYKVKDIPHIYTYVFFLSFICLIGGFLYDKHYFKLVGFYMMVFIFSLELVKALVNINEHNKNFKEILRRKDYNINVGAIKKEMVASGFKNVFKVLATPFLVLEKGIYLILDLIF